MASKLLPVLCISVALVGCGSDKESTPTNTDGSVESNQTPKVDPPASSQPDAPAKQEEPKKASAAPAGKSMDTMAPMQFPAPKDMVFKNQVQSNVEAPAGLDGLVFVDTENRRVELADYRGKKHVVLVFTEGFGKMLCPFCKTQTSRLIANYEKFSKLDAEVLVVYPGERDHVEEFIAAAQAGQEQVDQVPFPIVLDPKLSAVDHFDIRSQLAHPSTYVIDKQGNVQLAYVGQDMSPDRPSITALLETLQRAEDRN
jgi:peroxiredoxin